MSTKISNCFKKIILKNCVDMSPRTNFKRKLILKKKPKMIKNCKIIINNNKYITINNNNTKTTIIINFKYNKNVI